MLKRIARSVGFFLVAACAGPAPLRIAVVGGSGSPLGAVIAVDDINAAGGINGRLLELGVVDEAPLVTPRDAIAVADSLCADPRVLAVVGHGGSATSLAASQVYNARRVSQIAPNSSSPLYTHAGPYSFRLVASDEHQAAFMISHIVATSPVPRIAMLYVNDDYGRALHGFLRAALSTASLPVVYAAPFLAGPSFTTNLDDMVRSVRDANPSLLVWIGLSTELQQLRPRLRQALPQLRVFGSDGGMVGAVTDLRPFEGDWVVSYTDVTADRPALQRVAARFQRESGQAFTDGAALTYDAIGVLAEALRSGARDRAGIQKFLTSSAVSGHMYQGITGAIAFNTNGDALPSYVLSEITHGRVKRVNR